MRIKQALVALWHLFRDQVKKDGALRSARARIDLGRNSYIHEPVHVVTYPGDPEYRVTIGAYTSIAKDVTFLVGGGHSTEWLSTFPFEAAVLHGHPFSRGPIVIGNDVWIGMEALIMSGVSIGDGAIIGARSVVARDVPPFTIVAGSPARPIRIRFAREEVTILQSLRWWEWPPSMVEEASAILATTDISALVRFARKHGVGQYQI